MKHKQQLDDEDGRMAALRRYDILDTPPEPAFEKLTELVRNVLDVPIAAVSLIDSERQWFKSIAGLAACETSREISFCGHAIRQRDPLIIRDASMDVRFAMNPLVRGDPHIRSYLGIPLETPDGYNIGALCAIDTKTRQFPPNEVAILESFAKLVINEIELRQIAMSDSLTGAMTRRAWFDATRREFERSYRHGTDASVIVFDVDHFKQVNDSHGHPAGDAVLRTLAQRCFIAMRDCDMLGRIGGEEFALLLPSTNDAGASELAERLRRQFADTPVSVNGTTIQVTSSFGFCSLKQDMTGVDAWLETADSFLYEAKAGGRNRCYGGVEKLSIALS